MSQLTKVDRREAYSRSGRRLVRCINRKFKETIAREEQALAVASKPWLSKVVAYLKTKLL
jgi:hypothetical protein